MRWKCAIALWIWAFCILCWAAKNLEPSFDWRGWLLSAWELARVGILAYAGLLLVMANDEIEQLEHSNKGLEQIIGQLQEERL